MLKTMALGPQQPQTFTGYYLFMSFNGIRAKSLFIVMATLLVGSGISFSYGATTPTFNESSNGKTITLKVGASFNITLNSTYWQFTPMISKKIIASIGAPVYAAVMPAPLSTDSPTSSSTSSPTASSIPRAPNSCFPGMGCGTVLWNFKAKKIGTALIVATRTSCGEAMRCTPADSTFQVKIKVIR